MQILTNCFIIFSFFTLCIKSQNLRNLATCQCQVKPTTIAYAAYCTAYCNTQSMCNAYQAYCTWNQISTTSPTSIACPNNCGGHGTCNSLTGICTCLSQYTGSNCSTLISLTCPNNCSAHGYCNTSTSICSCNTGYSGSNCATIIYNCLNNCSGYGVCNTSNGICTCSQNYYGSDCSLKQCPNNCSGQGSCNTSTGICTCSPNFQGTNCSIPYKTCTNNCNGNGNCNNQTGICTCVYGWTGNVCTEKIVQSSQINQIQEIYIDTWSAWDALSIKSQFQAGCDGLVNTFLLAFGNPDQNVGISFTNYSPSALIWYNNSMRSAVVLYKDIFTALYTQKGIKSLISIGGWSFRNNFGFLAYMNQSQLQVWAQKVKSVVDSFGANGIDIDYETDSFSQTYNELIKNNVIHALRIQMPAPQYTIRLCPRYAATMNYSPYLIPSLYNPPLFGQSAAGINVQLLQQNWIDLDSIAIQSYGDDQNLDPRTTLSLIKQSINSYLQINNAESKLIMGGFIGSWTGCTTNWCKWQIVPQTQQAAIWTKINNLKGFFWWSDTNIYGVIKPYLQEVYKDLQGISAVYQSINGVC